MVLKSGETQALMFGNTNYLFRNTHGLKFGSEVLKFGLRNKNIAIVVHHS